MSSANSNSCHEASKSSNGSKRNITNRKYLPIQQTAKVLVSNNSMNNHSISMPSSGIPPKKDFIIKNKVKREYTN